MKSRLFPLPLLVLITYLFPIALLNGDAPNTPNLKIGIIGDSTVCDYPAGSKQVGWGQALPSFFSHQLIFLNEAEKGRSTKTFPPDRWKVILDFKPNFILIQFGHNDSHSKNHPESTDAATNFRINLKRYISDARASGAVPILVTPVHRRTFDASGHLTTELLPYANAMQAVAKETNTPFIDLYQDSGVLFETLGDKGSTSLTMNSVSNADQPNHGDRTHFTAEGAKVIAGLVAKELSKVDPKLASALVTPPLAQ